MMILIENNEVDEFRLAEQMSPLEVSGKALPAKVPYRRGLPTIDPGKGTKGSSGSSVRTKGLILYAGLYTGLSLAQQRAVHDLTVRRYIDEIYHLEAYLQESEGLVVGTSEFERAYAKQVAEIQRALAAFDDCTFISTILFSQDGCEWSALAAMRSILGYRADVPIADTIGSAESSIPTHRLFCSFRYPNLPSFDPDLVTEAEIFEASRLVRADDTVQNHLVESGAMSEADFRAVLALAFDELIVSAFRNAQAVAPMAAWIFNIKPRLASALRVREGLSLIPLYSDGVQPTEQALNSALDRPYFYHWQAELLNATPPDIAQQGIAASVRYMAGRGTRDWHDCAATLPYLVLNDRSLEVAIRKIETRLVGRPYGLIKKVAYA